MIVVGNDEVVVVVGSFQSSLLDTDMLLFWIGPNTNNRSTPPGTLYFFVCVGVF